MSTKNNCEFVLNADRDSIPRLHQYFGPWAIDEVAGSGLASLVGSSDMVAHLQHVDAASKTQSRDGDGGAVRYQVTGGGVAVVEVTGVMTKYSSSLMGGASTLRVSRALSEASRDVDVKAILMVIDSPGGSVSGVSDLGEAVVKAKASKPVHVFIEDTGNSGAYWIASQGEKITANAGAFVGSIGVYSVVVDASQKAAQEGVKVQVIRSGDLKGAGTFGTEITPEQIQSFQDIVDEIHDQFTRAVASGRGMPLAAVRALADGSVQPARAAVQSGLIDAVGTLEDTIAQLEQSPAGSPDSASALGSTTESAAMPANPTKAEESTMEKDEEKAPVDTAQAAHEHMAALAAACPGAESAFLAEQVAAGASVSTAAKAWMAALTNRTTAAEARTAELEKDPPVKQKTEASADGVAPLKASNDDSPGGSGDAIAEFDNAVRAKMSNGMSRDNAVYAVSSGNPGLHKAYLLATNDRKSAQEWIKEQ